MSDAYVMLVPQGGAIESQPVRNDIVSISKELGRPNLEHWNCKYIIPFWLRDRKAANRIFQIKGKVVEKENCFEITLGNSYLLPELLLKSRSHRRFVYEPLYRLKLIELSDGVLTSDY